MLKGYIGDRIGYRIVIIINVIIVSLSATSFDWTPRFIEYYRTPTITFNTTSDVTEVLQFHWPIKDCTIDNITINDCTSDPILSKEGVRVIEPPLPSHQASKTLLVPKEGPG